MMDIGTKFEYDLEKEFGLKRVPGSGNKWYNRLDVRGRGTRWSAKATEENGFRIDEAMLNEAISVTEGIGGTREAPVWAVRIPSGDFIIMRKEDWVRLVQEEGFTIPASKTEQKRRRANTPELFREEE